MLVLPLLITASALMAPLQEERRFGDTVETHAHFEGRAKYYIRGLAHSEAPDERLLWRTIRTRTQWARMISDALNALPSAMRKRFESLKDGAHPAIEGDYVKEWREEQEFFRIEWREIAEGWIREFRFELEEIGRSPADLRSSLNHCAPYAKEIAGYCDRHLRSIGAGPTFSDVPNTHWAFSAVHALRDVGILSGYSDATFRGHAKPKAVMASASSLASEPIQLLDKAMCRSLEDRAARWPSDWRFEGVSMVWLEEGSWLFTPLVGMYAILHLERGTVDSVYYQLQYYRPKGKLLLSATVTVRDALTDRVLLSSSIPTGFGDAVGQGDRERPLTGDGYSVTATSGFEQPLKKALLIELDFRGKLYRTKPFFVR